MSQYICVIFSLLFAILSCSQSTPQMPDQGIEILTEEEQMLKDLRQYPKNETFVKKYTKVSANLQKLENLVPEVPAVPAGGLIVDPGVPVGVVDLGNNKVETEAEEEWRKKREAENQKNAIIQTAIESQKNILKSIRFAQSGWTDLDSIIEEVRSKSGQSVQKDDIDVSELNNLAGIGGKIDQIIDRAEYFLDSIQDAENAQVKAAADLAKALAIADNPAEINKTLTSVQQGIADLEMNVFSLKNDGVTAIKTWTCNKAALAAMIPIGYAKDAIKHVKILNNAAAGLLFSRDIEDAASRSYAVINSGVVTADSIADIEKIISIAKNLAKDIENKEKDLIMFAQNDKKSTKLQKSKTQHYLKELHSSIAEVNSFLNVMKPAEEAFHKIKNN